MNSIAPARAPSLNKYAARMAAMNARTPTDEPQHNVDGERHGSFRMRIHPVPKTDALIGIMRRPRRYLYRDAHPLAHHSPRTRVRRRLKVKAQRRNNAPDHETAPKNGSSQTRRGGYPISVQLTDEGHHRAGIGAHDQEGASHRIDGDRTSPGSRNPKGCDQKPGKSRTRGRPSARPFRAAAAM